MKFITQKGFSNTPYTPTWRNRSSFLPSWFNSSIHNLTDVKKGNGNNYYILGNLYNNNKVYILKLSYTTSSDLVIVPIEIYDYSSISNVTGVEVYGFNKDFLNERLNFAINIITSSGNYNINRGINFSYSTDLVVENLDITDISNVTKQFRIESYVPSFLPNQIDYVGFSNGYLTSLTNSDVNELLMLNGNVPLIVEENSLDLDATFYTTVLLLSNIEVARIQLQNTNNISNSFSYEMELFEETVQPFPEYCGFNENLGNQGNFDLNPNVSFIPQVFTVSSGGLNNLNLTASVKDYLLRTFGRSLRIKIDFVAGATLGQINELEFGVYGSDGNFNILGVYTTPITMLNLSLGNQIIEIPLSSSLTGIQLYKRIFNGTSVNQEFRFTARTSGISPTTILNFEIGEFLGDGASERKEARTLFGLYFIKSSPVSSNINTTLTKSTNQYIELKQDFTNSLIGLDSDSTRIRVEVSPIGSIAANKGFQKEIVKNYIRGDISYRYSSRTNLEHTDYNNVSSTTLIRNGVELNGTFITNFLQSSLNATKYFLKKSSDIVLIAANQIVLGIEQYTYWIKDVFNDGQFNGSEIPNATTTEESLIDIELLNNNESYLSLGDPNYNDNLNFKPFNAAVSVVDQNGSTPFQGKVSTNSGSNYYFTWKEGSGGGTNDIGNNYKDSPIDDVNYPLYTVAGDIHPSLSDNAVVITNSSVYIYI